jgi:apolipoprotein N-acyltransferase
VSEKALVLLMGVVLAAGLAGVAVVTDDPLILAVAAAVAFVAVGYVMPARGLPLVLARRQPKPPGVARTAFLFTFLGISMVWATELALDFPDSLPRLAGWIALALFNVVGATIVAAARCAEDLKGDPVDEPTR